MKKLTLPITISIALSFGSILTGCGSSSSDAPAIDNTAKSTNTTTTTAEKTATLESYTWAFNAGSEVRSSAAVHDGIVFFSTNAGKLFALNASDGNEKWQRELGSKTSGNLLLTEDKILVLTSDGIFYALNSETGETEWQIATAGESFIDGWDYHTNSPIIFDNKIYLPSTSGTLYVLNIADGSEVTTYTLNERLRGTPTIVENTLYVSSNRGIFSINLADGSENWHKMDMVPSSPAVDSGVLVVGSRDTFVTARDAETGDKLWQVAHGSSWVTGEPLAHQGNFYIGTSDNARFQSINAKTGVVNWSVGSGKNVFSKPAFVDDILYMTSGDAYANPGTGYIKAFSVDGTALWSLEGSNFMSSPVVSDGVIYLGSDDGFFYAVTTAQ
ncbi:MAG: PQQ-binding-like beta-propeller repeat protein [Colwellia sp.]|nr:PQQ-binding-like beta-propeller repeat protein [Colwellia sp.]